MNLVYTVCRDAEEASEIGRVLVEKGLAACTNSWKIDSCFFWNGELENEEEVAMIVKTREEIVPRVFEKIKELHSYDVPALFAIPVSFVEDEYLEWLYEETE